MSKSENFTRKARRRVFNWPAWHSDLVKFSVHSNKRAVWQLINTLVPYVVLWYFMVRSVQLGYSYFLTLVLAVLAAVFLLRIFILFHDCVHNSFFSSGRSNRFVGSLLGVLVFTSFDDWRYSHLRHHGSYANLDARGYGDIWTMTLTEYENLSKWRKLQYRLYRNPFVLLGLGAVFTFLLGNRVPTKNVTSREKINVLLTDLLIVALFLVIAYFIGWKVFLLVLIPTAWLAGMAGIWLFYVQHQFLGGYWARDEEWDPLRAAMEGSSFYKLPTILRWFSGNIGYHHVHHLNPKIPNYYLKKCYDSVSALRAKVPLTLTESPCCFKLKLWDEKGQKLMMWPE